MYTDKPWQSEGVIVKEDNSTPKLSGNSYMNQFWKRTEIYKDIFVNMKNFYNTLKFYKQFAKNLLSHWKVKENFILFLRILRFKKSFRI